MGEKLRFEGEHYKFTLMIPNFVPPSAGLPSVPITIAAVGPHSLRLAGEVCDGVRLHPFCTKSYIENICIPTISEGMEKTGRKRSQFEVSGGGFVATGATDEEADRIFGLHDQPLETLRPGAEVDAGHQLDLV